MLLQNEMKKKRLNEEITYEEYIEWKLKYEIDKEQIICLFFYFGGIK